MKMRERIEKLFSNNEPNRVIKGKVVNRMQDGLYTIEATSGAKLRAESEIAYRPGEWVNVLQGRILGRTGSNKGAKIFDV